MTPLRISGKNLGQLALEDFCPRCCWLKLHCQQRLPFQIFPGIFSSIDAYTKRITNSHYEKHRRLPAWFDALGDLGQPIAVPHHTKFHWQDSATGILLTGAPDEMLRCQGNSVFIADYKTARLSAHQDKLLPMYRVQLNAYAVICERIGLGAVNGLALIYFEPLTDLTADDVDSVVRDDGFVMHFAPKVHPIALEPETIPPLLAKARAIYDLPDAPHRAKGCEECHLLDGMLELLQR